MSKDSHVKNNCDEIKEKNRTFKLGERGFAILEHHKTYHKEKLIALANSDTRAAPKRVYNWWAYTNDVILFKYTAHVEFIDSSSTPLKKKIIRWGK